jgi:hypothetical protein
VSESRGPRRIFGPKRGKATGSWIKWHNEELSNLLLFTVYYQNDEITEGETGGRIARMGKLKNP